MIILDIGCGQHLQGDIGIDIGGKPTILASAEHLPFRPKIFDLAVSYESIAHDDGPGDILQSLLEALKVAKNVDIYTWDEPMWTNYITHLPHTKAVRAYIPTWFGYAEEDEDTDLDFFIKLSFPSIFKPTHEPCWTAHPRGPGVGAKRSTQEVRDHEQHV